MLDTSLKSDYLRKADIVESVDKSTLAARRSFSFSALDHDPYVDGVVIRRPFEQNERKLDGRTIEWSMSPVGKVTISIVLKDDRRVETGVFDYATIFLALRYAADGRMLTTTVLNTEIPGVQNVLLRPALVTRNSAAKSCNSTISFFLTSVLTPGPKCMRRHAA